ncbi:Nucleic acid-binding OB-fold [Penicillium sp. CMV-2018d]|nr:Nucleic acid-binding OB-fold [Penicillium sp. CMV-2018d]
MNGAVCVESPHSDPARRFNQAVQPVDVYAEVVDCERGLNLTKQFKGDLNAVVEWRPLKQTSFLVFLDLHDEHPTQRSIPSTRMEEDLSDLLDTHQDRPTEVRRRDQVKIITTP